MSATLTELEGAILSEIHHRSNRTAYAVRRAFQDSPSLEWRGGAGSVYPAISRLAERGFIMEKARAVGRKAKLLTVTAAGLASLEAWASDPVRATSPGVDPFRLRSGIWNAFAPARRATVLRAVAAKIRADLVVLSAQLEQLDPLERERQAWAIDLQTSRLAWIELHIGPSAPKRPGRPS